MTTPTLEQVLDDVIADNAKLEQQLMSVGESYVHASTKLRRVGISLLNLEQNHPELASEIDTIRHYIWPERGN